MTVNPLKVMTVVGARPQFVKAAALSRAFASHNATTTGRLVQELMIHTGQHYDSNMSDLFFQQLEIPKPYVHLGIGGLSHGAMTGRMLEKLEGVIKAERPDWVIVFGDTDSTLAGALAAAKISIPVAHVEAGMRSYNREMPEEINRVVTDHLSQILFTCTASASELLFKEGMGRDRVMQVGDVMYDSALFYLERIDKAAVVKRFGLEDKGYALATIHRSYNTDNLERMRDILDGLQALSKDIPVILPLHPRTKIAVEKSGFQSTSPTLRLVEPLGYLDMLALEAAACLIVTDSGGVQKEAYFCQVPCVTVRTETEWGELVDAGVNRLSIATPEGILEAAQDMLQRTYQWYGQLFGDGRAAANIVKALIKAV